MGNKVQNFLNNVNDAQNILSIAETVFRRATNNFFFKINEVNLISETVQNTKLRSYYDNLCQNAESLVDEETSVNLLEQIVGLFIRVQCIFIICS